MNILKRNNILFITTLFLVNCSTISLKASYTKSKAKEWINSSYSLLGFQENKGQLNDMNGNPVPNVLFKAEAPGLNMWITTKGLTYQFFTIDKKLLTNANGTPKFDLYGKQEREKTIRWNRVDMALKGASIRKENVITQGDITQGNISYYLGHCPNGIFNVKTFTKITVKDVYKGIDWVLYTSKEGTIKHEFIVYPGYDPSQIKLIYEGLGKMKVNKDQIKFTNNLGEVTDGKLLCYQENENNMVASKYIATKNKTLHYSGKIGHSTIKTPAQNSIFSYEVSIQLNQYNSNKPLIIDPELEWGTFYGGNNFDGTLSIDTDGNNLFASGYTHSSDFPTGNSGTYYQGSNGSVRNVFILKFDNNGTLRWGTYYGGNGQEGGNSIHADIFGNIWVTGYTSSSNLPIQANGTAYLQSLNAGGGGDIFILKFDNDGNRLWATYYGSDEIDGGSSITTDLLGNVYIIGTGTTSTSFPSQPNGTAYFQNSNTGNNDAILLKFTNDGDRLWATYFGGDGNEIGFSIITDPSGNVYICGDIDSNSSGFPIQSNGTAYFDGAINGLADVFIAKFGSTDNLIWSTFYGGTGGESARSIAIDSQENLYVAGHVNSSDFPVLDAGGFFQSVLSGIADAYLLKFNSNGERLWATYFGGNGEDSFTSRDNLAIDNCNNIYMAFTSESSDLQSQSLGNCHYTNGTYNGGNSANVDPDVFISKFDASSNLLWASYIGANERDFHSNLAVDTNNNIFIGGEFSRYTNAETLPIRANGAGYFDAIPNGLDDGYFLKFTNEISLESSQTNPTICTACDGTATVNVACATNLPNYNYIWNNGSQILNSTDTFNTVTGLCPGDYNVIVTNNSCSSSSDTVFFTIPIGTDPIIGTIDSSICRGDSVFLAGAFQTSSGIYTIDTLIGGSAGGCDSIVEVNLTLRSDSASFSYPDTIYCIGDVSASPIVTGLSGGIFSIDNNGLINSITGEINLIGNNEGTYSITYTVDNDCPNSSNFNLSLIDCTSPLDSGVYVPTSFTPNNDNINDIFYPVGFLIDESCTSCELIIFNRWGEVIYKTNEPLKGWNGTFKGKSVPIDVYPWSLTFTDNKGDILQKQGKVTLVR